MVSAEPASGLAVALTALVLALSVALVVVGVVLARRGLAARHRDARLRAGGVAVRGLVADDRIVHRGPATRGQPDRWYQPVVRFRTRDGLEVVAVGRELRHESWVVGTPVEVRYDPGDPERVLVPAVGALPPSSRGLLVGVVCAVAGTGTGVLTVLARLGALG